MVDASVAVKWFVAEAGRDEARRIMASSVDLVAPDLILAEVANALRKKVVAGEIASEQAHDALTDLPGWFSRLVRPEETTHAAFDLALALSHPFPDCVYLACATMNGANMVTDDRTFLDKAVAKGHSEAIVLLQDWREP